MTGSTQEFKAVGQQLSLAKYSFGVGDRFARQAKAQLRACMLAAQHGVEVIPVWNKSNREHLIVGSDPGSVRTAAEAAVRELNWTKPFHIDADHVTMETVDRFLEASDFFTIDVATAIGTPAAGSDAERFVLQHPELLRPIELTGRELPLQISHSKMVQIAQKYLFAVQAAGHIYRHIEAVKGQGSFITEVSMDETDCSQKPEELLVILAALAEEGVPIQTIAPKFTGRFNKGVDYIGDPEEFEAEFRSDVAVVAYAARNYPLPPELKLSVHTGSDKFSIYPAMHRAMRDFGAGVHVKTAGTTWLEEVIGLAESGGEGLALAKEIYAQAFAQRAELCAPYASVIDIDTAKLPLPGDVNRWTSERYARALRHDWQCAEYNPSLRQLIHVGFKIAAKLGRRYLDMVEACEESIARNVTANLYERHLRPLFL
ncbi:MAG: tagaturonate epimerase family protein [Candidatus Korobacteraceae bacterium]|jgi:hypothetical protein